MTIISQVSQAMHTLLTTTEAVAAKSIRQTLRWGNHPDHAIDSGFATLKYGLQAANRALPIQYTNIPASSLRLADHRVYHLDCLHQLHLDGVFWLTQLPSNALRSSL